MGFEQQTGLKVELIIPNGFTGEELEPNLRINLLSILREALNNIRKHAEANHVRIVFLLTDKELCTTVEDDGKGFDVFNEYETKGKYGIEIMRERALEIGAKINWQSAAGKGTRIDLCLPKEEKKDADEIDVGR